ncbi:Mtap [Columba livia]|nr:Mtap [Columba livia]
MFQNHAGDVLMKPLVTCRNSILTEILRNNGVAISTSGEEIGIIGGTGLDDPDILEGRTEKYVDTPYGKPSDALILGKIKNVDCVLLARHGRHHTIMPSNVNYRANIWALKEENCSHVLVTTACGSLREEIQPGDLVIIDQFIDSSIRKWVILASILIYLGKTLNILGYTSWIIVSKAPVIATASSSSRLLDRTTKRHCTLYDGQHSTLPGVCHIPMAEPFCTKTREVLIETAKKLGLQCHSKGTMITIEGPRFSSQAESLMFRSWGADVINMTTVPEVILAKEAGMSYASIAMATDYDCWKEHEEAVSVDKVLKTLKGNANKATSILLSAIPQIGSMEWTNTLQTLKITFTKYCATKNLRFKVHETTGIVETEGDKNARQGKQGKKQKHERLLGTSGESSKQTVKLANAWPLEARGALSHMISTEECLLSNYVLTMKSEVSAAPKPKPVGQSVCKAFPGG